MADRDVHLLNPRRRFGGDAKAQVAYCSHLSPRFACQADDGDFALASRLNCAQNIRAVAAGGDRQQHITWPGMGRKLAGKNMFISVIVSDGRKSRGVTVQRNGSQGLPLEQESSR